MSPALFVCNLLNAIQHVSCYLAFKKLTCLNIIHLQLQVYHAWKSKNAQTEKEQAKRAPTQLHEQAKAREDAPAPPKAKPKKEARPQRYFRIPFTRPEDKKKGAKKGWWFAHFDGQWIARQMELHPEKPPVLLVAGKV